MSATIATHIESVAHRADHADMRVITGAGIYSVRPGSPVGKIIDGFVGKRVLLSVSVLSVLSVLSGYPAGEHRFRRYPAESSGGV